MSSLLVGFGASLAVLSLLLLLLGYLVPSTRPWIRRWWWVLLATGSLGLGAMLAAMAGETKRKPGQGSPLADTAATGKALQQIGEEALARSSEADAELARGRFAARSKDPNGVRVAAFDVELDRAKQIEDPTARRAALVALVERAR